jgi:RNA polymerase sigma-70 factor (ECF subfamily)
MDSGSHSRQEAESDAALLEAIAAQESRAAFQELFTRYVPRLKAHFMRSGQGGAQAEDLAQDVLLNVWHYAGSYRPELASVSTWIFRIARNRFIDVVRRQRYVELSPHTLDAPEHTAEGGTLDDALSQHELSERLNQAIEKLTPEQAEVIRGSYFAHESATQIAARLQIPTGTVKSRLRAALNQLQKSLDPEEDAP